LNLPKKIQTLTSPLVGEVVETVGFGGWGVGFLELHQTPEMHLSGVGMTEPLAYKNGQFVPRSALNMDVHDVGYVAGATITDYCRTYNGKLFHWPRHLARFRSDCASCDIPLSVSDSELTAAVENLVGNNYDGKELAIITCATPGTLGYMGSAGERGSRGTVLMHTFPVPLERYKRFFTEGVDLVVVGNYPVYDDGFTQMLSSKHRSRIYWHLARQHQLAKLYPHAIPAFRTADGHLDTAVGSVLSYEKDRLTSAKNGSALNAITAQLLHEFAVDPTRPVVAEKELFLAGSAFGIAGIRSLRAHDGVKQFPWPGPALAWFTERFRKECNFDFVSEFTNS
jgi:branched-chain amino acid aminotransferase